MNGLGSGGSIGVLKGGADEDEVFVTGFGGDRCAEVAFRFLSKGN